MATVLGFTAGSYEQIAFGFRVTTGEQEWTIKTDFSHHAHTASVSAVAANQRFIATGSKDETIQLYDMKKRVDHGALLHHNGTISCLQFYGSSHLLSGSEDGLLCVWRTRRWECLKSIKAHKGQVTSLSVHPSGKLALSVGTDKTLRTWNLIDGRCAFIKNIKQNAHIVLWSPDGDTYAVVIKDKVDVYNLETATVVATIRNPKRISSVVFLSNSILAVVGDDEMVRLSATDTGTCVCEFTAHQNRVKAVDSFVLEDYHVLVTASNDGFIKMWRVHLDKVQKEAPPLLGQVNTSARLTCLAVWQPGPEKEADEPEESAAMGTASQELREVAAEMVGRKRVRIAVEEVVIEGDDSRKKRTKRGGVRHKQKVK